jgi:hypothetical protein
MFSGFWLLRLSPELARRDHDVGRERTKIHEVMLYQEKRHLGPRRLSNRLHTRWRHLVLPAESNSKQPVMSALIYQRRSAIIGIFEHVQRGMFAFGSAAATN